MGEHVTSGTVNTSGSAMGAAGGEQPSGTVVVLEAAPVSDVRSEGRFADLAASRRIGFKLLLAFALILVLMLFSADQVDFVYKGF